MNAVANYWKKVSAADLLGCWEWTGARNSKGYPCWSMDGHSVLAHRVAYTLAGGAIPDGYTIDHLCRNKKCVNPSHLEPVTVAENIRRARAAAPPVTTCKLGHPLMMRGDGRARYCPECENARRRVPDHLRKRARRAARAA